MPFLPSFTDFGDLIDNFSDLVDNPLIEIKASFDFAAYLNLPWGTTELVQMKLEGFEDEDGDLKPEFKVDLEFFDRDVFAPTVIELDPAVVQGALTGKAGLVAGLFESVFSALKKKGVKPPPRRGR